MDGSSTRSSISNVHTFVGWYVRASTMRLKCLPHHSLIHPAAVAIALSSRESSLVSVIPSRSCISSRLVYHNWLTAEGMTRQVPGWTSLTTPLPTHSYPHSPSIPATDGEHGTDKVYLPVITLTMSAGAVPR